MKKPIWLMSLVTASIFATLASGCGKQSFEAIQTQQNSDAPGSMSIAPKVDIILAVDNSGSTFEIQNQLNAALRTFLANVNNQNWDYRITAIPLLGGGSITRIAASKFDANWGAEWVSPYPGAPRTSTIPASMFVKPDNFSVVISSSNAGDGNEPGLAQIGNILNQPTSKNSFFRPEAALAVVVLSNGEDTSDGTESFYPYAPKANVSSGLIDAIRNAKGAALAGSVRLFSVVNTTGGIVSSCYGETAWAGNRYIQAAQMLGGTSHNLCQGQMSTVLTQLQADLKAIKLNYVKRYVLLNGEPNVATIKVTKHAENGSTVVLPESAGGSAGWKYLGQANVPMISEPIEMDFRTGYAIQLIGEAYKLTGGEYVTVEFLPAGVRSSN